MADWAATPRRRVRIGEQRQQRGRREQGEQGEGHATLAVALPPYCAMNVGNVSFSSTLAMVNSPSTTVAVRNDEATIALRRFGIITRDQRRAPARAEAA